MKNINDRSKWYPNPSTDPVNLRPATLDVSSGSRTVTVTSREENRSSTLDQAKAAVLSDRNADYGDPEDNFAHIAAMWNAYLKTDDLLPTDVAAMMMIVKLARITTSPKKQDHWVDAAGYAACGYGCAAEAD